MLPGLCLSHHPESRLSQPLLTRAHSTPRALGQSFLMSKSSFSCCGSGSTRDLQSRSQLSLTRQVKKAGIGLPVFELYVMLGLVVMMVRAGREGAGMGVLRQNLSEPSVWPGSKAKIKKGAGGKEGKAPFSPEPVCV